MDTREDSRAELVRDEIESLDKQIALLREQGSEVNRNEIDLLEKAKFDKEKELDELTKVGAQDDLPFGDDERQIEDVRKEEDEIADEQMEEKANEEMNNLSQQPDSKNITDWLKQYGLSILAEVSSYDNGQPLTEEEFLKQLEDNQAPVLIKDPEKANMNLTSAEEWNLVKTSRASFENAVQSGKIPTEAYKESYILLERGDGKSIEIHDKNSNGYIDKEEARAQGSDGETTRKALEESIPPELLKEYEVVRAEDEMLNGSRNSMENSPLADSIIDNTMISPEISGRNVSSVTNQLRSDVSKEREQLEEEIKDKTGIESKDMDDMDGEISFNRPNY